MTNDESNSNDECSNVQNAADSYRFGHSSLDHSDLIRHSSFEFRHSVSCSFLPQQHAIRLPLVDITRSAAPSDPFAVGSTATARELKIRRSNPTSPVASVNTPRPSFLKY